MKRLLLSLALLLTLGAGCADAFTWRTSTHGTAAGTTITVTEPTGITSGDYEFCVMDTFTQLGTITTPTGWTLVMTTTGGAATKVYVFEVTGGRGASAPTLAFTASQSGDEWACGAFSGSNHTRDAATNGTMLTSSATQPNPPAATATFTNDEAIAIGMNFDGLAAASFTSPTGYTGRSLAVTGSDLVFASKDLIALGSEDPSAFAGFTTSPSTDVWAATILVENSSPTGGGGGIDCGHMLGVWRCDEER